MTQCPFISPKLFNSFSQWCLRVLIKNLIFVKIFPFRASVIRNSQFLITLTRNRNIMNNRRLFYALIGLITPHETNFSIVTWIYTFFFQTYWIVNKTQWFWEIDRYVEAFSSRMSVSTACTFSFRHLDFRDEFSICRF